MNLMYCGDRNIQDGVLLSVLSLCHQVTEPLHIYILTVQLKTATRNCQPVTESFTNYLEQIVQQKNAASFVQRIDVTQAFQKELPGANLNTRFTPCCMLRLWADELAALPDRILYLDNDVICRRDCTAFYHQDLQDYEFAGVLDYYGRWFFHQHWNRQDYVNSGVLLLNLSKIRQTGLFKNCRRMCTHKKMFMPDQSSLNKLAVSKKLLPRRYNEQRQLQEDTVFQHFTTTFRFFPWIHTVTVKPWQIERMHNLLNLHEYDALLEEYRRLRPTQN